MTGELLSVAESIIRRIYGLDLNYKATQGAVKKSAISVDFNNDLINLSVSVPRTIVEGFMESSEINQGKFIRNLATAGDSGKVTCDSELYQELVQADRKLRALEQAGVDNWEGYDTALDILSDLEEEESDKPEEEDSLEEDTEEDDIDKDEEEEQEEEPAPKKVVKLKHRN